MSTPSLKPSDDFISNCQSLDQFNDALEQSLKNLDKDITSLMIGKSAVTYDMLVAKFDELVNQTNLSPPKLTSKISEIEKKMDRVNASLIEKGSKIGPPFILEKTLERIQHLFEKVPLHPIYIPLALKMQQKAMQKIFEYTFTTLTDTLLQQYGESLKKKLDVNAKGVAALKKEAAIAIESNDPKAFMNCMLSYRKILKKKRFFNPNDIFIFHRNDYYIYKIIVEGTPSKYFIDCHALEAQVEAGDFFIRSLLPEQLKMGEYPATVKVLKESPIGVDLLMTFLTALAINPDRSFLDFLVERPSPEYYPMIKELVEKGLTVTPLALKSCLKTYNYKVLALLLSMPEVREVVKKASVPLLRELLFSNDVAAAKKLYLAGLDLSSALTLVSEGLGNCEFEILEWLIDQGVCTSNQQVYDDLLKSAVDNKNLKIIRLFAEKLGSKVIQRDTYPDCLKIDDTNAQQLLKGFILCSPLDIVEDLIKTKKLDSPACDLLKLAPLFVRFPKQVYRERINGNFKDLNIYIESSWTYAVENLNFIEKTKNEFKNLNWQELLALITQARYDTMPNQNSNYLTNTYEYMHCSTPLLLNSFENRNLDFSRYASAYQYLSSLIENKEIAIDVLNNKYTYYYQIPDSNERVPMTTLAFDYIKMRPFFSDVGNQPHVIARWDHTPAESCETLIPHINKLHKELIDFDLKIGTQAELSDKIARCYWLIGTMCQKMRGTPHNAMMWLNMVATHHGLPPLIPKMQHFFLDNTALVLPVEEFIKRFDSFFEPELTK